MQRLIWIVAFHAALSAQEISTAAGDSSWGYPVDVAVDTAGNIYATDQVKTVIYRVNRLGETVIIAGTGGRGFGPEGVPATQATFGELSGIAVAPDGTVYVADTSAHRVRRIAPNGIITTIAGTGRPGFSGDGGPASAALLFGPLDVALDAVGNLYVTDAYNYRIRRITPAGTISTVAGTGRAAFSGDGGPPLLADCQPSWLTLAPDGTIYFTDDGYRTRDGNKRVRRIRNNVISTVAGSGSATWSGDGGPASAAGFASADGIALDPAGNLYVAEYQGSRIRRITPDGTISTYAGTGVAGSSGDGGPANRAQVRDPIGLAIDNDGNLLIADSLNARIRRVSQARVAISSTNAAVPSFLGRAGFSSNSYVEIYGTNLSTTTRVWGGADFNGSRAPTSLDGVSVTVNGRPAFVYFISPTQININAPDDTATGPVNIQVTNSLGASNIGVATRARVSPTLHSIATFTTGGRPHVVAQTPDFRAFIGRPGMVTGVSFAPAKPGDTVIIYALGCGPTAPATEAGLVASQNSALSLPFEVRVGGRTARVTFGGASGGTIGLYQFNVVIPEVAGGDQAIELVVDGVANGQNLVIAVDAPGVITPPTNSAPVTYTFSRIANAASGSGFQDFLQFCINDSGLVAFNARRSDSIQAIYTATDDSRRTLITEGSSLSNPLLLLGALNNRGALVYQTVGASGFLWLSTGVGTPTQVASGDNIVMNPAGPPDIDDNGAITYLDGLRLLQRTGSSTRTILDAQSLGSRFPRVQRFQVNQQGEVAMTFAGPPGVALYRNGQVEPLLRDGDTPSPSILAGAIALNDRSQTVFQAAAPSANDISYFVSSVSPGLRPTTVWRGGGTDWESFGLGRIGVNNGGTLLFVATAQSRVGLFTGPDLARNKAIAVGDPLFGSTVSGVSLGLGAGRVINNRGQFVFGYRLANQEIGIAVATPTPQ